MGLLKPLLLLLCCLQGAEATGNCLANNTLNTTAALLTAAVMSAAVGLGTGSCTSHTLNTDGTPAVPDPVATKSDMLSGEVKLKMGAKPAKQLKRRLDTWLYKKKALCRGAPLDRWQAPTGSGKDLLQPLRDDLRNIHKLAAATPGISWSTGVGANLRRAVWDWEATLSEHLGLRCYHPVVQNETLWEGDIITERGREESTSCLSRTVRLMFLNVRHIKSGVEGWMLRDGIWEFAKRWDLDWVGLSDHCLQAPPGPAGKWDRTGAGVHKEHRYRASGVQAAAAKGFKDQGWGGQNMTWAFQQGLPGASGPVGGTLLAARSGWDRADREISDKCGWGRFTGRAVVGAGGRMVVIVQVQGPTPSAEAGSQWVQQAAGMEMRRAAGETMEPSPASQFLLDLYKTLEPHVLKGHGIIVGGDFNLHWDCKKELGSATFAGLHEWAHALQLVNAARHKGHTLVTWRKSQAIGASETEPDHIFLSKALAESGAVKCVAAYCGQPLNNSDHRPLVLEISLALALGLSEDGLRLPPPPVSEPIKMLRLSDEKALAKFRKEAPMLVKERSLSGRLQDIEAAANRLVEGKVAAGDLEGDTHGEDVPGGTLEADLEEWWKDAADCLLLAQQRSHKTTLQCNSGSRTKHHWSSEFAELSELYHEALDVVCTIDQARCGPDTRSKLLAAVRGTAERAGRKALLSGFPAGRYPKGAAIHMWCKNARAELALLLKELHCRKRDGMRADQSERHAKVSESIALGRWKGLFRSELKRSFTSQSRHVVMTDVTVDDTGETERCLLYEPDDVKDCVKDYFACWFGKAQSKWYRTAAHTHLLFRRDAEGAAARRALVRGHLNEQQRLELMVGLPPDCEVVLDWWHRKEIEFEGERREIRTEDFDDLVLDSMSEVEWLQLLARTAGNKAADAQGVHINLFKALLAPKRKKKEAPAPGVACMTEDEEAAVQKETDDALGVLNLLRQALNVTLLTGVVPSCLLDAVLCTIGKVEGSIDLKDSRPLTLLSIALNLAVGVQVDKVMHRLEELGAIDDWQAGFRKGMSTEGPLLEGRLIAEHCWQYCRVLWAGDEDKSKAFDSPPEESVEMAMDRFAIPRHVIQLVKLVGNRAQIRVRTAHGLADPFTKVQGFPQGGRHSPHLWTIFDDPLCTAMSKDALSEEGDPVVVRVPFAPAPRLTGKSYADDKRFVASTAAGMQRRFDLSSLWNAFNAIATNVKKSAVQALVQTTGGKWELKEDLPNITMTNWVTGECEVITKHDPDDPLKSLGMQTTAALSDGYATADAKLAADRVAVCVTKGNVPDALWRRLVSQVAERSAMYKIRISCASPEDIREIYAKCHRAFKAKSGLCVTTPDLVVSALVTTDWTTKHFIEQLVLVLNSLQRPGSNLDMLLRAAMQHHALWQGGFATLGGKLNRLRGWDGTLLGQLHMWMMGVNLELRGPIKVPPGRHNDCLLAALADTEQERCLLSRGSWVVDAWRVSDMVRWDGTLVTALSLGGTWSALIDDQEKGMGDEWCALATCLVSRRLGELQLGSRARGGIRLGAYVCIPAEQAEYGTGRVLTIGHVVADDAGTTSWEDLVKVKILRPLYGGPDDDRAVLRSLPALPLKPPIGADADTRSLRGGREAAGAVHAVQDTDTIVEYSADQLLEIKVVELRLPFEIMLDDETSTNLLVQLDENLFVPDAAALWTRPRQGLDVRVDTFQFSGREQVIGLRAAADKGWPADWELWDDLKRHERCRTATGLRTTLRLLSDGSVVGDGFAAHSTYGWLCYGVECDDGLEEKLEGRDISECIIAGCGVVAGPPEWTSSTRAEAAGALAALMGAVTEGWRGDIDLRLDNDSAVGRAGGLVLGERHSCPWDDVMLVRGHAIENADIWTEFVAWRDRHTSTGAKVRIQWHPGHPERRRKKADWSAEDRAIYVADQLAEAAHEDPAAPRALTEWSHQATWKMHWRGEELAGSVSKRLEEIVRTEQLAAYVQSVGIGPGTDTEWLIPELMARTIGRKEGELKDKVHRAKAVADILGTKHTQHRRGGLDDGEDVLCRLCGDSLETDSHVLWECKHPATGSARRALAKKVRTAWRSTGLGSQELAVVNVIWGLKNSDAVRCRTATDIQRVLGPCVAEQAQLLVNALLGHTLDISGMYSDRMGLFGKGWICLLQELGLDRPSALNALVAVANVLQGKDGTRTIWEAFTTSLGAPEREVAGEVASQMPASKAFGVWAAALRLRLREELVESDEPYRILAAAGAVGMSAEDMANFACLVQDWIDAVELCDPDIDSDVRTWATDTADAVEMAGASVALDRRTRGRIKIKARDLARVDAKFKALDRRAELLVHAQADHTQRDRELLKKSIAKLKGRRKLLAPIRKPKAAPKPAALCTLDTGTGDDGVPAAADNAPAVEAGIDAAAVEEWVLDARANRAEQRTSRREHESTVARKTSANTGLVSGKHRSGAQAQPADEPSNKRMRAMTEVRANWAGRKRSDRAEEDSTDTCAHSKRAKPTRLTGQKRAAEPLEEGNMTTTDRARRALTRERLSIGTTNLEPD
jgi:ribonuclease HI